jgi:stringent starvation protein B
MARGEPLYEEIGSGGIVAPVVVTRPLPPKKDVMLKLLEKSGVFVHVDPRRDGVSVPNWFSTQPELVLQVGLNMAVAIPDLEVDDEGIFCTLSFNRRPFYCRLPWHAVYALVSDEDRRGVVWPEDAPRESQLASPGKVDQQAAKRPKLRAVGADETAPTPLESGDEGSDPELAEGSCGECGMKWVAGQTSCPVCGAGQEAYLAGDAEPAAEPSETALEPPPPAATEAAADPAPARDDEPKSGDDDPKPKRPLPPYLRVVK